MRISARQTMKRMPMQPLGAYTSPTKAEASVRVSLWYQGPTTTPYIVYEPSFQTGNPFPVTLNTPKPFIMNTPYESYCIMEPVVQMRELGEGCLRLGGTVRL